MRFRIPASSLLIGISFALVIAGCASHESAVIATIGGDKIRLDEFNAMFAKNNGGTEAALKASREDKEKFLELYLKFRLKVKDAYVRGYQNDPDVRAELEDYRRNLAMSYLIDKEISGPSLQRMYDRRLVELRASHILIHLPSNPIPPDTFKAYTTAMKIIDSLKTGRSFEELALNNSQDPSVSNNKGDLYYFTSGAMVPEFEEAAYSVQAGTVVPFPVRTQFGYHVIKVTERHPNPGTIRVSHIMRRLVPQSTREDSLKALNALQGALDSLKHGGKFPDLAKDFSDDKFSSERGGDLGFIARRRTVQEFDNAAFKLKAGEISGIVKTKYGFHLIQVNEIKPVPSFAEMEEELKKSYQQYRFQPEYDAYVNALKKEYKFAQSSEAAAAWNSSLDTAKTTSDANWDSSFSAMTRAKELFSFAGGKITVDSALHLVKANTELRGLPFSSSATSAKIFDKISNNLVMDHKARSMESHYQDFAKIMKEYEEGIMLFKAEQNEVWNKVSVNDSAMHMYFDANRAKYTWPDRVNIQEIFVATDSIAKVVTFLLKKQKLPFDSVAAQYNTRQSTNAKRGEWGMNPATTNALTQRGWNMKEGEVSEYFPYEKGFSIIKMLERDHARDKTFAEAGSELSGAFQEYESKRLENEWYESLKKMFPISTNTELLKNSLEQTPKKETPK
jgi:peptidyl-prolyl cis-trans isomerase SurA